MIVSARSTSTGSRHSLYYWGLSFDGQLTIRRPRLTEGILATMGLAAWHVRGRKDEDPTEAARVVSKMRFPMTRIAPTHSSPRST